MTAIKRLTSYKLPSLYWNKLMTNRVSISNSQLYTKIGNENNRRVLPLRLLDNK